MIEVLLQELNVVGTTTNEDASLVMIPSAGSEINYNKVEECEELWTEDTGLSRDQFTILHPERANPGYTGVEDAAEAHKYTRTLDEMWNLLT